MKKWFRLGIALLVISIIQILVVPIIAIQTKKFSFLWGTAGIVPLLVGCYLIQANSNDVD